MSPGFSLLEVLAALTLIAVVLLGLVNGLLSTQLHILEVGNRLAAALYAENNYEQMQANSLGVKLGAYYQTPSEVAPSCNPCDPQQQAAKDLAVSQEQITQELNSGELVVEAYGHGQRIQIRWQSLLKPEELSEWVLYGNS